MYYSKPIFIESGKAVLIFSSAIKNKKNIGGKAIGNDILEVFVLKEGHWEIMDHKRLSAY